MAFYTLFSHMRNKAQIDLERRRDQIIKESGSSL